MWQCSTVTSVMPPDITEPITTPPWLRSIRQWRMATRSVWLRGSFSPEGPRLPALMAMQLSPTEKRVPMISTSSRISGLKPWVLGVSRGASMVSAAPLRRRHP
nr:hypothetical protein [Salipiger thiooxidans]